MKRPLIIIAAIILLIGIGVAAYFLFFSGSSATLTTGNPFGDTGSGEASATGTNDQSASTNAGTEVAPHLVRITSTPVSLGTVAVDVVLTPAQPTTTSTTSSSTPAVPAKTDVAVRYIDRASGNVYNYYAHARQLTRLSNRTLPGIQTASWLADGSFAFVQFLAKSGSTEQVKSYALPANGTGGFFLEDNLASVEAVGSSTVFSLLSSTNSSTGTVARADGSNVHTLFTSLLSMLTIRQGGGAYFAYTKPSSGLAGYAFVINPSGSFTRVLGAASGLSILPSPTGKTLLYSYVDGGTPKLGVMDVATRSQTALPLSTLTEKCVWAANGLNVYCGVPTAISGTEPDDWYQGAVSFTDRIWKISLTGRVATLVVDPTTVAKTNIDVVSLSVDPSEDVLIFTDKKTNSLWAYDL